MTKSVLTVAAALLAFAAIAPHKASAQSEILAEMYGRGVHAYYAGDTDNATRFLTMAIDNGIKDPRAYYFRGLVAHMNGNQDQAEIDWQMGADMEAASGPNPGVGRSLSRFQGSARLTLESIRQEARLKALATATSRAQARYGEIQEAEARVLRQPPKPVPPTQVTPPPTGGAGDPFADDMASGPAKVDSDNALKDAMKNPFGGEAVPAGAVPPSDTSNPFGGGADAAPANDNPFGGGGAGGADNSNPFGGAGDSNPFSDDPNPFGN